MTEPTCRRIVAARSGGTCERCGVQRATEKAHRKPRSQGGGWTPDNVTDSCGACHRWETGNPQAARAVGWRLWRGDDPQAVPFLLHGRVPVLLTAGYRKVPASSLPVGVSLGEAGDPTGIPPTEGAA